MHERRESQEKNLTLFIKPPNGKQDTPWSNLLQELPMRNGYCLNELTGAFGHRKTSFCKEGSIARQRCNLLEDLGLLRAITAVESELWAGEGEKRRQETSPGMRLMQELDMPLSYLLCVINSLVSTAGTSFNFLSLALGVLSLSSGLNLQN